MCFVLWLTIRCLSADRGVLRIEDDVGAFNRLLIAIRATELTRARDVRRSHCILRNEKSDFLCSEHIMPPLARISLHELQ